MTAEEASIVIEMLTGNLPFFPTKPSAQALIATELQGMCETLQQGTWLARRMCQLLGKWEGPREMRAIFCSKHSPRDGLEAYSGIYLDGIPSERAQPRPQLLAGEPAPQLEAAGDEALHALIAQVADCVTMPTPRRPRTVEEISNELYKRKTVK